MRGGRIYSGYVLANRRIELRWSCGDGPTKDIEDLVVVSPPPLFLLGRWGLRRGPGDRRDVKKKKRGKKVCSQARSLPEVERGKGCGVGGTIKNVGRLVGS